MKRIILATTALIALALPGLAQDRAQLIAAAGLSPAEARTMSLTEIAAAKFNRDNNRDTDQTVSGATAPIMVDPVRDAQLIAAADLTPEQASRLTLTQLATGKYNAGASRDDVMVMISTRGPAQPLPKQLIAAAGLTPVEARGLSLTEIYVAKINREGDNDAQEARF